MQRAISSNRSSKSARSPLPPRESSAKERLQLLELLLDITDVEECAQRILDWKALHAGVAQALVLMPTAENPTRMVALASHGLGHAASEFSLDLEDLTHPLVEALAVAESVYFPAGPRQPKTPLSGGFSAVPLRLKGETRAEGLLLTTSGPELSPEEKWSLAILRHHFDRLRSNESLAVSRSGRERRLLHSIINAVTDPILLADSKGTVLIANARAERLFSAPDEASEGRRRAVAMNNMLFSSALSASAMEQEEARTELTLVDPADGSDLLFELITTPVKEAREGTGVVSILRNITDLGRASEEIRESQKKLAAAQSEILTERHRLDLILASVADPIIVTDPAGDVILMNGPADLLFNVPGGGGQAAQRAVLANDAHFSSFVSNLLSSGSDLRYRGEIGLTDPGSGRSLPVEAIAGKVLSEYGELTAVVTILHDRTEALEKARLYSELKKASEGLAQRVEEATSELAQQNERLRRQALEVEQASAMKSQFLANMSHELRTPLNAILGYTQMLLKGVSGELSAPQRKSCDRVDSNARHLLSIINEILDITRIEAGKMPLSISSFAVKDLVQEVLTELEPIVQRSRLKLSVSVPPAVPPLRSDRQKVKQILVNLLSNALKFTPQGSVTLTAAADRRAGTVSLAVADTGIGIAPADQERVFEDFRQVDDSPTRQYSGAGLGLSIVRRLAAMLDGTVALESALGKGSTFTLTLPRRRKAPR